MGGSLISSNSGKRYEQVRDHLMSEIKLAEPQEKLPAEDELARRFAVSRGTIRQALREVQERGLIVRVHGKGTFVSTRAHYELQMAKRLISLSEDVMAQGIESRLTVISTSVIAPPSGVSDVFDMEDEDVVFRLFTVRHFAAEPGFVSENFTDYRLCPGIEEIDFSKVTLLEAYEQRYGLSVGWAVRSFSSIVADEQVSSLLAIDMGTPVLGFSQTVYLTNGRPIEWMQTWCRQDQVKISTTLIR